MEVTVTPEAQKDIDDLTLTVRVRIYGVLERLAKWPAISGVERLKGPEWKGCFRIRTGDYRVIFRPETAAIYIIRVAHRREVYE